MNKARKKDLEETVASFCSFVAKKSIKRLVPCFVLSFFSLLLVSGSEDMAVYSFTHDSPDVTPVTKFLGHSAPVLDVCWNYDETLMASCDMKVRVSVN